MERDINLKDQRQRVIACEQFIERLPSENVRSMADRLKRSGSELWSDLREAIMHSIANGSRSDLEIAFPEYAICNPAKLIEGSVVAASDSITTVTCKVCDGLLLACVEKFIGDRDRRAIQDYRRAGHKVFNHPSSRKSTPESCMCAKDSCFNVIEH